MRLLIMHFSQATPLELSCGQITNKLLLCFQKSRMSRNAPIVGNIT